MQLVESMVANEKWMLKLVSRHSTDVEILKGLTGAESSGTIMGLPLLRLLFRKMWNTRWMTFSTLIGLIVAVAFTSSIPMYADGALKRVDIAQTPAG